MKYKGEVLGVSYAVTHNDPRDDNYKAYLRRKALISLFEAVVDKWGIEAVVKYKEDVGILGWGYILYTISVVRVDLDE